MKPLDISRQTLSEFIAAPFGVKDETKRLKYEDRYKKYKSTHKIKIESTLDIDNNYFIHLKVPSESKDSKTIYDVVVQFFSPSEDVDKNVNVEKYYVQFFSNSPGFVYKYATLYRLKGYLIETLQDKFTPGVLDILPEKANKDFELSYDSTIYYACRYLLDNRVGLLGKLTMRIFKNKTPERFFAGIQETETMATRRSLSSLKEQLKKEIRSDIALSQKQESELAKKSKVLEKDLIHRKSKTESSSSTLKNKEKLGIKRIKAKGSSDSTSTISVIKRKKPVKSTRKKK